MKQRMIKHTLTSLMIICSLGMTACSSLPSLSSMSLPVSLPSFSLADNDQTTDETENDASKENAHPCNKQYEEIQEQAVDQASEATNKENKSGIYQFKFPHLIIR